jgi:hypothetical protein
MKEYFIVPIIVAALIGLIIAIDRHPSPEQELLRIEEQKKDCVNFKRAYETVNPVALSENLGSKIALCKKVGAWPEPSPVK